MCHREDIFNLSLQFKMWRKTKSSKKVKQAARLYIALVIHHCWNSQDLCPHLQHLVQLC